MTQRQQGPSWGLSKGPADLVEPQAIFSSCCRETKNNQKNKQADGSSNIGYFGPGMSSCRGRGHTRGLRARTSPCAQQTSGPERPTSPVPPCVAWEQVTWLPSPSSRCDLGASPTAPASAPSSVKPRPLCGRLAGTAPGPAEAVSALAREECAAHGCGPASPQPMWQGGGTTEKTQGQEVGEGVRKDTPLPANEGTSAGPRFPRGVLAL